MIVVALAGALSGCSSDGAGSGADTLPKRGELVSDPTIVSATAKCSCGDGGCGSGDPRTTHVRVELSASDSMGEANLSTCAVTIGATSEQDGFYFSTCVAYLAVTTPCAVGQVHTADIIVSNNTGGVTTASVDVTVSAQ